MDEKEPNRRGPDRNEPTKTEDLLTELEKSTSEMARQAARTEEYARITNGPRVRWSYISQTLNRTMHVYINKLNQEELKEFRAAEAIITRLASDIKEEETRIVRKLERDE